MTRTIVAIILFFASLTCMAKEYAWVCAIEWTEKRPEWIFVYENIKEQTDGYIIFVKWEFPDDAKKSMAKQTWLVSRDFSKTKVVKSVGYDKQGKIAYSEDEPYGPKWNYVMPETISEAIVETARGILLKK